ncbi:DUF1905 domain-containing protein [Sanguibacter sp. HDW7]|uniref:DUF1905 domain-containing protein n=1 Tax=Sanguibacter sp. HDW7 TaxID=2714931 RepID=UPI00140865E6|nr:DUF1905 domain-containing protein [Sanguibacter sp. HDW7]QIK84668.1 DUF1905 domain-containing protein [Sanguibacter sp. HDW7]
MELDATGEIIEWRGPAPFLFVPLDDDAADAVAAVARDYTYGWGALPAEVRLGRTVFRTSLFPRAGTYYVPVKVAVQRAEGVGLGDVVAVHVRLLGPSDR